MSADPQNERPLPAIVAGEERPGVAEFEVLDKATGAVVARVARAGRSDLEAALDGAQRARRPLAERSREARSALLERVADGIERRRDALADRIVQEAGKPIAFARGEVERAIATFRIAAREALRLRDREVDVEGSPGSDGFRVIERRVPIGVCAFITPFNFPLNLVAHKVAPALAAGCPFVVKPASATPLSALELARIVLDAGAPPEAVSVLPLPGAEAEALATDERVAKLSFTGSAEVGWRLREIAGRKRVTLELGGNAAVIVDETADLDEAVRRIVFGAFYQAGQSCISVQRVLAVRAVHDELRERLVAATRDVVVGDPRDERTVVGPVIDEREAARIVEWIERAKAVGARVLVGGGREGVLVEPTLVEGVPAGQPLLDEEVFGPVAVLQRVDDFDAALGEASRTRFGLQAGVFTRDEARIARAWEALEVGCVVAGDVPSWRADAMPYGGVKDSGVGREGPRYAIEEMTERRLLALRSSGPE